MCLANIKEKYPDMSRLEVYNLAAQSHVKVSFEMPEYTADTDAFGTLKLLEAIRSNKLEYITRFYQASTSELYGKVQEIPQKETTPFYPRSPYGVAKLYAYWIVKNYREAYGLYACNGILFNHEGPRRGHNFVTRKITIGLGKILRGETDRLIMGNIDSLRDWGCAKDYVEGMWMMLQADKPEDFVLATGQMHTVKEFIENSRCQEIRFEPLRGALGIALTDVCIISTTALKSGLQHALYVIFHEVVHHFQYTKHGENFVEELYFDRMDIDKAVDFLLKTEITADRYAISKVKQLFAIYFPNEKITIKSLYKSQNREYIKNQLLIIRNVAKKQGLTTGEEVNQLIYNSVKG
jgi:hypothetical protein